MSISSLGPSRQEVWKMFDAISGTYDKINHFMTLGLDLYWRKKVTSFAPKKEQIHLLDCATGTGDQLFSFLKHVPSTTKAIGVDLSAQMLEQARNKRQKKLFSAEIEFQEASILALPFEENSFDVVTIAFGIRNVTDVPACLREILRVLKPGGRALILETSTPKAFPVKHLHSFYLKYLLPLIGHWVSKKGYAYRYLHQTATTFPCGKEFCQEMEKAGFAKAKANPLSLGAVSIYTADKTC
jgi:demethylmenaquinone methyltransferase/2-methoxy-6-polyprenyl-1,4-benzoquinol methylase